MANLNVSYGGCRASVAAAFSCVAMAAVTASADSAQVLRMPRAPASIYTYDGVIYDRLFSRLTRPPMLRAVAARAQAPNTGGPSFSVTDLGILANIEQGSPLAINNAGNIAYYSSAIGVSAFVVHPDGSYLTLFTGADLSTIFAAYPYAINNTGYEAGFWSYQIPGHFFKAHADWTPTGGYLDPTDSPSVAYALNDANVSVGQAPINGNTTAALFQITAQGGDKRPQALLPPKNTSWIGTATGINDAGKIVGYAKLSNGTSRAVQFNQTGYATVLPVGAAGVSTSAQAVNQHGDVVGNAGSQAFLYKNNRVTYLPRPPGDEAGNAVATAINASDEIVGTIVSSTGPDTAFLYLNGRSYDLNTFVPPGWRSSPRSGSTIRVRSLVTAAITLYRTFTVMVAF